MISIKGEKAEDRFYEIYNDLINLAINRFSWENLPYGLTTEKMEEMLITYGQLMCFKSEMQGIYILPCMGIDDINVYGIPTKYNIMSLNGKYEKTVDIEEGVLIKNNPTATENITTLSIFAKRINDTERTQDVNLFQQNIPKIILSDENSKLTAKNIVKAVKEFSYVIFGKKSLNSSISTSEVLDTSSPYLLDKLQEHKTQLYNEVLTYLGINNNNIIKKERLVVDEVNANNDFIEINIDLMYDMRKKACEEINKKFGLNIIVKRREIEKRGTIHNDFENNN